MEVLDREILTLSLDQLKHGENLRDVTKEKVSAMMKKLRIAGKIDPVVPFIVLPADENGIHPTHDGNTRLAALKELGYTGNIKAVEITSEQATNKEFLVELQSALGTSNNRLTEIENAKGVVEWILSREQTLLNSNTVETTKKARAQAIQQAAEQESFDVDVTTIRNYLGFFELEEFIRQNTVRGLISTIANAVHLERTYRKLVKDFGSAGYKDNLKGFYGDCLDNSLSRKKSSGTNGGVNKADIDAAAKVISDKYKTEATKAEIQNEKIQEALDAGTITHEGVEKLKAAAEAQGISLDDAFDAAVSVAEDYAPGEGETIVTNSDLDLGLKTAVKDKAEGKTKEDLAQLTIEELESAIFGSAVNLLLTVGGDANDLIAAIKSAIKNYQGLTVSDYDRTGLERLYRASTGLDTTISKVEKSVLSRKAKAKKEAESLSAAEEQSRKLAESLANLEALSAEDAELLAELPENFDDEESNELDTVEVVADEFDPLADLV